MTKLSKKLVEVMKDCRHIAKNGTNNFHGYKYATSADVLGKVNASLTKYGISTVVTPNLLQFQDVTTAKGNIEHLAIVEITATLTDSESGEIITLKGLGSGQDAGDKSVMKAQTAALKYCYLLSLAIATGDDPEADTSTDEAAISTNAPPQVKPPARNNLSCHDCGTEISQKVADYSKNKYGKCLCFNCQKTAQKVA